MSFEIKLQKNNSPNNMVTKTLTDIATISGTLKTSTSVVDPTILVEGDITQFVNANYVTIPAFNRSYFIKNITSIRGNLFEIQCHCDVLASFAAEIRACSAIVSKNQSKWNLYLNDGTFRVYQNPIIQTKAFPSGFSVQEIVLMIAG